MQERIRRRVLVSGRVQGVAFRASTRSQARAGAVAALVAWCREGPRFARVAAIDVHEEAPEGLADFHVR